jgi:hypothetical protein
LLAAGIGILRVCHFLSIPTVSLRSGLALHAIKLFKVEAKENGKGHVRGAGNLRLPDYLPTNKISREPFHIVLL